jgi:hypothetical protein
VADDSIRTEPEDEETEEQAEERGRALDRAALRKLDRDEELSTRKSVNKALLDIYKDVEKGFDDQRPRADQQMDDWDIFNCVLGSKQFYNGTNQLFMPIVRNAIEARKTRFTNQIFPTSQRNVEVISSDGETPNALVALLEHYIKKARLRTQVMPALMKNGDVEGQYNIYVSWRKTKRHVVQRVRKPVEIDEGISDPDEDIETIEEETLTHGSPLVEVIADSDVLVLPQTADSEDDALAEGGSVTILRRWSKARIRRMIKEGDLEKQAAEKLLKVMADETGGSQRHDKPKEMVDAAGIKKDGRGKFALVYETWTVLAIEGERRICRAYLGGPDNVLGCKRNPLWSDHLPLISSAVAKVQGAFKGKSQIDPVRDLQYLANDTINESADSAVYALMPIVMTDPAKNPRVGSMILSMAAIWETNPNDTKFAQFPEMWKQGLEMVATIKSEVFQTLSVNPAAITQSNSLKKQNQAEVAQNAQVDILTTADAVTVVEEGILTPMLNRMIELDHQYRDEEMAVAQYGELGHRANIEKIPPVQFNRHYQFRWLGVESARNAQMIQQQIAGMNVIRGIPPEQLNGYKVNLVPVISKFIENTFGPRLAPLIFISPEMQMPVPVNEENMLLSEGYKVPTHDMDDDDQHIQAHMMAMKMNEAQGATGGTARKFQEHIFLHMQQKAKKQQAAMAQQQGAPGVPGGAGPGVAGTPRPGAQPGQPRGGQNPPGAIHADQMPGAMPRKM